MDTDPNLPGRDANDAQSSQVSACTMEIVIAYINRLILPSVLPQPLNMVASWGYSKVLLQRNSVNLALKTVVRIVKVHIE
jgi:hypothetical protein